MDAIISLALALLQQVLPTLTTANAGLITKIVEGLIALIPILVNEYKALLPMIQNVITALKSNGNITADQLTALDAMEAQIDAAFEQAATNAQTEDASDATKI